MLSDWQVVHLGEVSDLLTGFPFKSKEYVTDESAPRLLRGDNIAQGWLRWDGAKRWPISQTDDVSQYWLQEGDVTLAMDRPWIDAGLKYAAVRSSDTPSLLVQRVARIRGSDQLDTGYLKYVIGSRGFTQHVLSIQTGTAVPHISAKQIKEFQFPLPAVPEQHAIAHILGTLDDKIELNRRMNKTLEAMARALFHDWFVAFGPTRAKMAGQEPYLPKHLWDLFPDDLDDELPQGWSQRSLADLAQLSTESIAPGKDPDALFEHFSIPAFDAGKMPAFDLGHTIKSNKYVVNPTSVLVSKLNPETPRIWMPSIQTGRPVCSTEFMQFAPHDEANRPYLFALMDSQPMRESVLSHVTGSTGSRQRAQPKQIAVLDVLAPSQQVLVAFNRHAGSLFERIGNAKRESATLSSLRDTLLPKLISGELRVPDAQRILERAL